MMGYCCEVRSWIDVVGDMSCVSIGQSVDDGINDEFDDEVEILEPVLELAVA